MDPLFLIIIGCGFAAVLLVGRVLPMHLATSARLLIQVSTGAASYAISNIALRSAAFLDLKQQLSGRSLRADPTGVEA